MAYITISPTSNNTAWYHSISSVFIDPGNNVTRRPDDEVTMILIYYPQHAEGYSPAEISVPDGVRLGYNAHTDSGLLTILYQDGVWGWSITHFKTTLVKSYSEAELNSLYSYATFYIFSYVSHFWQGMTQMLDLPLILFHASSAL